MSGYLQDSYLQNNYLGETIMTDYSKIIFVNADGDYQETAATDSLKYASFKTADFELTNTLLGKLVNAISTSAGEGDVGKFVVLDAGGQIDASMVNDGDISHDSTDGAAASTAHTSFPLLAGGRDFTAIQQYNEHKTFTTDEDMIDKKYVDDACAALGTQAEWQDSCLDELLTPPSTAASKVIQDLTFTAKVAGEAGNLITIDYTDTVSQGNEVATRVGNAYSVAIEAGVSTATQIKAACDTFDELINCVISGTGGNAQSDIAPTYLLGGTPVTGARYLINGTGAGGWSGKNNQIAEYNGSGWDYFVPTTGTYTSVDDVTDAIFYYSGSAWVKKYYEATTASLGCKKSGIDIESDLMALGGLALSTNSLYVDVDGSTIERNGSTGKLQVKADGINDTHLDFGTGSNQISATDLPIADSAGNFDASDVEAALAELATTAGSKKYQVGTNAVSKGDIVYLSANNKIQKMPINAQHEALGIALEAGIADAYVRVQGFDVVVASVLSSAALDDKVYWDGSALTQTIPSGSGAYVWQAGLPVNATDLAVKVLFIKKNA